MLLSFILSSLFQVPIVSMIPFSLTDFKPFSFSLAPLPGFALDWIMSPSVDVLWWHSNTFSTSRQTHWVGWMVQLVGEKAAPVLARERGVGRLCRLVCVVAASAHLWEETALLLPHSITVTEWPWLVLVLGERVLFISRTLRPTYSIQVSTQVTAEGLEAGSNWVKIKPFH